MDELLRRLNIIPMCTLSNNNNKASKKKLKVNLVYSTAACKETLRYLQIGLKKYLNGNYQHYAFDVFCIIKNEINYLVNV